MSAFLLPVDIANRGLQHCGSDRIATSDFSEISVRSSECAFVYDKLRRAELQRNTWRFAIREAVLRPVGATTMLLVPALWVASTTYFVGSIVSDSAGIPWVSQIPNNLNFQPGTSSAWAEYFGPMTVSAYDSTTTYFAGELVYTAAGDGTNRVFVSLISANADVPGTATAWSATGTYFKNQTVTRTSVVYQSLIDLNVNQDPASAPALYNAGTTYGAGARVGASDGVIYTSVGAGNLGHDPTTDAGVHWTNTGVLNPWTTVFVGGSGSLNWRQIGGAEFPMGVTVSPLYTLYPPGAGPSWQDTTRNVYRLPAGFLRKAAQDPKAGAASDLGAPSNRGYDDWEFQDKFLVSSQSDPIVLRFVADTVDVTSFDDMFCEGLGARIGFEVCERVTQSSAKKQTIAGVYQKVMSEARTVNAILTGSEEPPLDDYLAVRY